MNSPIKVAAPAADERTPEQLAAAAPVSLPAGSFDSAQLAKDLEAAKARPAEKRDDAVDAAVRAAAAPSTDHSNAGVPEGYRRAEVIDEETGAKENRVVFDAPAAEAPATPAKAPADAASKGE